MLARRYDLKPKQGLQKIVELAQAQQKAYRTTIAEDEALLLEPGYAFSSGTSLCLSVGGAVVMPFWYPLL